MRRRILKLKAREVEELFQADIPATLATLDPDGYRRITPIWFIWTGDAFVMTSRVGYPHLENLARDPKAALAIDLEEAQVGGHRPNKRIRAQGLVELFPDDGEWTSGSPVSTSAAQEPRAQPRRARRWSG